MTTVLVFGGAGFVGLNIAAALLADGQSVRLFDRVAPPPEALASFGAYGDRFRWIRGDVTEEAAIVEVLSPGIDAVVMGAAITADAVREAAEPETILAVNLAAIVPILRRAAAIRVRRIVNLSSGAAYGAAAYRGKALAETVPAEPESLYAVTKFAGERVARRLATHWGIDLVSVRLSSVFGPWECSGGVRDTPSPQAQIMEAAASGRPALLSRPGLLDWIYAPDVAAAVLRLLSAPSLAHALYNMSTGMRWPVLAWGERVAAARPGFVCRLAVAGEAATVMVHGETDRAPLAIDRMAGEFGWRAAWTMEASASDLSRWWGDHRMEVSA